MPPLRLRRKIALGLVVCLLQGCFCGKELRALSEEKQNLLSQVVRCSDRINAGIDCVKQDYRTEIEIIGALAMLLSEDGPEEPSVRSAALQALLNGIDKQQAYLKRWAKTATKADVEVLAKKLAPCHQRNAELLPKLDQLTDEMVQKSGVLGGVLLGEKMGALRYQQHNERLVSFWLKTALLCAFFGGLIFLLCRQFK